MCPRAAPSPTIPGCTRPGEIRDLATQLAGRATLVPAKNLVDRIWKDRPGAPVSPIEFLGHNRAGKTSADKIAELQASLVADSADAAVLTLPESICWLLNMRGRDVPNTPFVLGFAIVPRKGKPTLFLDPAKITPGTDQGTRRHRQGRQRQDPARRTGQARQGRQIAC